MGKILDGKQTAKEVRRDIKQEIKRLGEQAVRPPRVIFIQLGDNPASTTYVNMKHKMATRLGIDSVVERLPESMSEVELLEVLRGHNSNPEVHGILVQLPLPEQIDEDRVVQQIDPRKDIDCFHPVNVGRLSIGLPGPRPATPLGVVTLLDAYGIELEGRRVTIVGRSNLVGKPLGLMLLARHATLTWCHSRTRDLAAECQRADILIAAAGKAELVGPGMVKEGAVVVDVGTNFIPKLDADGQPVLDEDGQPQEKLVGDVDFAAVRERCSYISPVPGGVGPMTIASVLANSLTCYKLIEGLE
jgi:methylenetetrahydrofolate dehydrogenase (NADP+)/methenyltetrahydrofolate cyclohydrolase